MKNFTNWLVRRCIRNYRQIDDTTVRARYGVLEAITSIIINLVLFAVKLWLGIVLRSVSIIADAVHTLSDSGTSIIILIGFKIAQKPGDREHPFGHGRAESVAALIVAVVLAVAGIELLQSSVVRIWRPGIDIAGVSWTAALILMGTIVVKELTARFAGELGRMIQSKTLEADAWHHRTDAISTLLVLVAMGCAHFDLAYVDGVAGAGVALIVLYSGYAIARDAMGPLLGERPDRELLARVEEVAGGIDGVRGVHDVIVHRYGQINLISLHIEVDDRRPVGELHDLSEIVEDKVEKQLGGSAVVHIDPLNTSHERYGEIKEAIQCVVAENDLVTGFHDLRLVGHGAKTSAIFDITLSEKARQNQAEAIIGQLREEIVKKLPGVRLAIKAEPQFAYSNKTGK